MEPVQSRMARAALGWRSADLAAAANIGSATVARFELGQPVAVETISAIRTALEKAGVILIPQDGKAGPGVRLSSSKT